MAKKIPTHLRPFVAQPRGTLFTALNALRALSVVALMLVLASNIVTIVDDSKAIKARRAVNATTAQTVTFTATTTSTATTAATAAPSPPAPSVVLITAAPTQAPSAAPSAAPVARRYYAEDQKCDEADPLDGSEWQVSQDENSPVENSQNWTAEDQDAYNTYNMAYTNYDEADPATQQAQCDDDWEWVEDDGSNDDESGDDRDSTDGDAGAVTITHTVFVHTVTETVTASATETAAAAPTTPAEPAAGNLLALAAGANPNSTANVTINDFCNYIPGSTVPTQTAGAFWSILNRIFIIFEAILLVLAELGFPRRIFEAYIPMLGPGYGLGTLGVLQGLIASSVLSHHVSLFPQVAAWLLFIVGCFNILVGIFLREKAKTLRSLSWERKDEEEPTTRAPPLSYDWYADYEKKKAEAAAAEQRAHSPHLSPASVYSQTTEPARPPTIVPGARFGGFSFGKQAEAQRATTSRPYISRPIDLVRH